MYIELQLSTCFKVHDSNLVNFYYDSDHVTDFIKKDLFFLEMIQHLFFLS